ncbi:unnamed protein product [Cladocopium goreaui]|uniref:PKHD-type hydroxylase n=1 Tax=Cladocopium goreaui TaxID=2562237 RepID=A0A9P1D9Q6_9DINO|nr:unnamed protein product [Cladocopium goreaui]
MYSMYSGIGIRHEKSTAHAKAGGKMYCSLGCGCLYFDWELLNLLNERLSIAQVWLVDPAFRGTSDSAEARALTAFGRWFSGAFDIYCFASAKKLTKWAAAFHRGRAHVVMQCDSVQTFPILKDRDFCDAVLEDNAINLQIFSQRLQRRRPGPGRRRGPMPVAAVRSLRRFTGEEETFETLQSDYWQNGTLLGRGCQISCPSPKICKTAGFPSWSSDIDEKDRSGWHVFPGAALNVCGKDTVRSVKAKAQKALQREGETDSKRKFCWGETCENSVLYALVGRLRWEHGLSRYLAMVLLWLGAHLSPEVTRVRPCHRSDGPDGTGSNIFSTRGAFAAVDEGGAVVTWGHGACGGDSSAVTAQLQEGVTQVYANDSAFAALRRDRSVVAWGAPNAGGSAEEELTGVIKVFSTDAAFAVLRAAGEVFCWGDALYGGCCGDVKAQLQGVCDVSSSGSAFSALRDDGSVVSGTWSLCDVWLFEVSSLVQSDHPARSCKINTQTTCG